jgi:protein involved in polysaccharide export with SLBB domain
VNRPGEYVIGENERLSDIITKAGGYKENAYIYGSALFRNEALDKEKLFAQLNYSDTVNYIISNIGKTNAEISSSVLDLLAEELRSRSYEGRVVTDFNLNKLKANPGIDIKLFDKDKIVIPEIQKVVYLFGDFRKPSNYVYDPMLNSKDYIKLAGGLKDSAYDEILVIDPDGKTHIFQSSFLNIGNSVEIYPGSIIYAQRDIGKLSGLSYASAVSPILSSLAISLASLNSITND